MSECSRKHEDVCWAAIRESGASKPFRLTRRLGGPDLTSPSALAERVEGTPLAPVLANAVGVVHGRYFQRRERLSTDDPEAAPSGRIVACALAVVRGDLVVCVEFGRNAADRLVWTQTTARYVPLWFLNDHVEVTRRGGMNLLTMDLDEATAWTRDAIGQHRLDEARAVVGHRMIAVREAEAERDRIAAVLSS